MTITRRDLLQRAGLFGCSLAASPLVTPVTWAAAPWDQRLVVIILRGGMDGLDVVRPVGDPDYAALRPRLSAQAEARDLDGFFAMHQALGPVWPLWQAGELGFVHAVSTPYRDKRSHFDGQDLLEAGTSDLNGTRDGWLNRLLQATTGLATETAYAIGQSDLAVLRGPAPVANWSPDTDLTLSPQAIRLMELVLERDPALHAALSEAQSLAAADDPAARREGTTRRRPGHVEIAEFAGRKLADAARIAAFSINGWDTHRGQTRGISRALTALSETLLTLRDSVGRDVWAKTAVLALTEFGRTARENGSGGTDHGTGGVLVMAGGAVKGGRVFGDWPGLTEADLYDRRDVMPTRDVRAHVAWAMRGLFGLEQTLLQRTVFPGLDMGADPGLLL